MKKLLLSAALLSVAAPAFAADLPTRSYTKAAVVAPVANWGGFHIGANFGGGWSKDALNNEFPTVPTNDRFSGNASTMVGGGQIGYNFQFAPNWVIGIEAAITAGQFDHEVAQTQAGEPLRYNSSFDAIWEVTGRLGYASNNWFYYGKGGYASTQIDRSFTNLLFATPRLASESSNTANGYVVGGGVEYALTPNWIVGVEYKYYNLESADQLNVERSPFFATNHRAIETELQTVTARVNYKFGGAQY